MSDAEEKLTAEEITAIKVFLDSEEAEPKDAEISFSVPTIRKWYNTIVSRPTPAASGSEGERDNCKMCLGSKGGVRGNENRIRGVVVCDYCTVMLMDMGYDTAPTPAVTREQIKAAFQEAVGKGLPQGRGATECCIDAAVALLSGATVAVDRETHRFKTQAVIREAYKAWTPLKYEERFDEYMYDALIASGLLGTKGEG